MTVLALPLMAALLAAGALPLSWKVYEKGKKVMEKKMRAGLLFFAAEGDEFTTEAETSLFSRKTFLSKMKKVVPIRIESGEDESKELCEEFDVVPGTGAIVIIDVQGIRVSRHSQDLDAEAVEDDLKRAIEVSADKAKVLKPLVKYHSTGKKAYKKRKYAAALQSFHLVLQIQEQKGDLVESPLYDEAETAIEEIREIARKLLAEGTELAEKKQYAKASNIARNVLHSFPDEQIEAEAKDLLAMIEQKQLDEYKGR